MKKETLIILIAAISIGIFFFSDFFLSSDEKEIKRLISQIEETLEFSEPLSALQIASRVRDLEAMIEKNVNIELTWSSAATRNWQGFDTIKTGALAGSQMVKSHSLTTVVTDIQVTGSRAQAKVQVVSVGVDSSGESFRERALTKFEFIKGDSDWTVQSVSVTDEK